MRQTTDKNMRILFVAQMNINICQIYHICHICICILLHSKQNITNIPKSYLRVGVSLPGHVLVLHDVSNPSGAGAFGCGAVEQFMIVRRNPHVSW